MIRRITIVILFGIPLVAVATIRLMMYASARGGGATFPYQPARIVSIGVQPDYSAGERAARPRLLRELGEHPSVRYVEIRWVDSAFFGFQAEHQWELDYDRQMQTLQEYYMYDGAKDDWSGVSESILHSWANSGFDDRVLIRAGCHSRIP